jgi:hypothetical protein
MDNNKEEIKKLCVSRINTIQESRYFSKSKFSENRTTNERIEDELIFKSISD